ncbi:MAG: DUF493 domain-containing protein [Succinivibrio sp.]
MADQYSKLLELMEFPCVVDFRIIVDATVANSIGEIRKVIEEIEPEGYLEITAPPRQSTKGKYVSYTVPVRVSRGENLKALYEKICSLDCVKHVL